MNKTTGAGPITVYRPNDIGELVAAELLPAPSLDDLAERMKPAKRGPKTGAKRRAIEDRAPGTFPSEW